MNIIKQKQTHRYGEQISCYQWEEKMREGQDRGRGLGDKNYFVTHERMLNITNH